MIFREDLIKRIGVLLPLKHPKQDFTWTTFREDLKKSRNREISFSRKFI